MPRRAKRSNYHRLYVTFVTCKANFDVGKFTIVVGYANFVDEYLGCGEFNGRPGQVS